MNEAYRVQPNQMQIDWENRARTNAFKAIKGNEIPDREFWESGHHQATQYINPHILSLMGDTKDKTLLEIGCGCGRLLKSLAPSFGHVIGMDISEEMLVLGREYLPSDQFPNIDWVHTDGSSLRPVLDNSVDLVVSFRVLPHVPSVDIIRLYLQEIRRVLKNEGGFIIDMPTLTGSYTIGGFPVFPRRLRPFIPEPLRKVYHASVRTPAEERSPTWRGCTPFSRSEIIGLYSNAGLHVDGLHSSGVATKRLVVGRRSPFSS